MGNIQSVLSWCISTISSKFSLKALRSPAKASIKSLHHADDKEQRVEELQPIIELQLREELQPSIKNSTKRQKVIRFQSFDSCVECSSENTKAKSTSLIWKAASEFALTCSTDFNPDFFHDGDSETTTEDKSCGRKEPDVAAHSTVTCFEEVNLENDIKQCTLSRTISNGGSSTDNLQCSTNELWDLIKDKLHKCCENERSDEERDQQHRKSKRKTTVLETPDGAIPVTRSAKDVATYCMDLLTAQFAGQTTSSLKTDCSNKRHRGPHLGDYLRLMDAYLRHFDQPEDFTGEEEYYLKLLWYIATTRHLPKEAPEMCFERLKLHSKRFVKIYLERGKYSQPIRTHNDFWGSRQQLLSGKVIADWVDHLNGPLDPIFGVLLQPTAGRAGPGDAGLFHQVMFDGNGPCAYHSAVHDAFGYLKTDHDVGPGYDYMQNSHFQNSRPVAGQIGGLKFWKKVLQSKKMKHNVMDLTTVTLELLPMMSHEGEGTSVYL